MNYADYIDNLTVTPLTPAEEDQMSAHNRDFDDEPTVEIPRQTIEELNQEWRDTLSTERPTRNLKPLNKRRIFVR